MNPEISTDLEKIKALIDATVKSGLFNNASAVIEMQHSFDNIFNYVSTAELVKEKKSEKEKL